jgi:hypothetical protein
VALRPPSSICINDYIPLAAGISRYLLALIYVIMDVVVRDITGN